MEWWAKSKHTFSPHNPLHHFLTTCARTIWWALTCREQAAKCPLIFGNGSLFITSSPLCLAHLTALSLFIISLLNRFGCCVPRLNFFTCSLLLQWQIHTYIQLMRTIQTPSLSTVYCLLSAPIYIYVHTIMILSFANVWTLEPLLQIF